MKELVESIARALVDHPDEVQVKSIEGAQATILELRVHKDDLGKVIGRQDARRRRCARCWVRPA